MKFTLRLGDARNLSRATAWICCHTNFAFPGCGSLMAGRKIGYAQVTLTLLGFALTTWFGTRFCAWGWRHWPELITPGDDPVGKLLNVWQASRWALAGMAFFGGAWLWALTTSMSVLRQTRPLAASGAAPPVIGKR
jgi:hypothetical protein